MKFPTFLIFSALCSLSVAAGSFAQVGTIPDVAKRRPEYVPLKRCWEYPFENAAQSLIAVVDQDVYFADPEGRIRSLSLRNARVNWLTELGGRIVGFRAVPKLGLAVLSSSSSTVASGRFILRLIDTNSGLVKYSTPITAGNDAYIFSSGNRLIISDRSGQLAAFDAANGEKAWAFDVRAKLSADPAASSEHIVVATDDLKLSFISIATGKPVSTVFAEKRISTVTVLENGMVVVGDDRGGVVNYRNASGERLWRFKSGARVGTISETPAGILLGSFDNFLYMLSKYTGDVKWKRRLDGRIRSAPAVLGGQILAASSTEGNAQVLDLESGKPVDRIEFGENRFMLQSPEVAGSKTAIFTLVDGFVAYSSSPCGAK